MPSTAARPVRVCFWRRSEETANAASISVAGHGDAHEREFLDDRHLAHVVPWKSPNVFSAGSGGECSRVTCFSSVRRASFDCAPRSFSSADSTTKRTHQKNSRLLVICLRRRSGSQSLRCKGAETRMLVPFSICLFKRHPWNRAARGHHTDGSGGTGGHGQTQCALHRRT